MKRKLEQRDFGHQNDDVNQILLFTSIRFLHYEWIRIISSIFKYLIIRIIRNIIIYISSKENLDLTKIANNLIDKITKYDMIYFAHL